MDELKEELRDAVAMRDEAIMERDKAIMEKEALMKELMDSVAMREKKILMRREGRKAREASLAKTPEAIQAREAAAMERFDQEYNLDEEMRIGDGVPPKKPNPVTIIHTIQHSELVKDSETGRYKQKASGASFDNELEEGLTVIKGSEGNNMRVYTYTNRYIPTEPFVIRQIVFTEEDTRSNEELIVESEIQATLEAIRDINNYIGKHPLARRIIDRKYYSIRDDLKQKLKDLQSKGFNALGGGKRRRKVSRRKSVKRKVSRRKSVKRKVSRRKSVKRKVSRRKSKK